MSELLEAQKEIIKQIISTLSGHSVNAVIEEVELKDGLGLDSLDIVELVMKLEEEFDCNIPDDDYDGVKTVGEVFKIVSNRI